MSPIDELTEKAERLAGELRWQEAVSVIRKAIEIAPHNLWLKDKLGWYLSRSKQYSEAIAVYTELVQQAPDNPKYPYTLGYQYYAQQQYAEAIPWFQRALDLNPDYLVVLYRKGYAHTQVNEIGQAETLFRRCVQVWQAIENEETKSRAAEDYSDACFQLGKIHSDRNDWTRAVKAFAEAVNYDKRDADKLYNLGKAYVKTRQFAEAHSVLTEANQLTPRKHYIQTYLAIAYQGLGQCEDARRIFEQIPSHIKDQFPYIWEHQADLYLAEEKHQETIRILSTATRRPNEKGLHSWHNVFMLLGRAYEQSNNLQEAYTAYQKANHWHQKSKKKDSPAALERLNAIQIVAKSQEIVLNKSLTEDADRQGVNNPSTTESAFIKRFFDEKGYGFIQHPGGEDLFVHIKNVINPDDIRHGAHVEYEVGQGRKGPEAVKVRVID